MRGTIIVAPGLNGSEMLRSMAMRDVNTFNVRIMGTTELSRYALMSAGVVIDEEYVSGNEECVLISEASNGIDYFSNMSYTDITYLSNAVRTMRMYCPDDEEMAGLEKALNAGIFMEKNAALLEVFKNYTDLCRDKSVIDRIGLIRKAICLAKPLDYDFVILKEYPLTPIERRLVEILSESKLKEGSLPELFDLKDCRKVHISKYRNCYGYANEIELVIEDAYKSEAIDQYVVAMTKPSEYVQLIFDYATRYKLPMTFGTGIPITNSNPAKLLYKYYHWVTDEFFSPMSLKAMINSPVFDKAKLYAEIPESIKNKISSFEEDLFALRLCNDKAKNDSSIEDYSRAVSELNDEKRRSKLEFIPVLKHFANELALPTEEFISKYARIRKSDESATDKLLMSLDMVACSKIYDELSAIKDINTTQSKEDIIKNVLSMNILRQNAIPGYLHVTGIEGALSCVRDNLYIIGLSAGLFPGLAHENYLLLDEDIKLFGEEANRITSEQIVLRKKDQLMDLVRLATKFGSNIVVSYSGINVSTLKYDNESSLIYDLYKDEHGTDASGEDMENIIEKVGYFDPSISVSREIGKAVNQDKIVTQSSEPKRNTTPVTWAVDRAYSPSALKMFADCKRKFMFKYVLEIPEPEEESLFETFSVFDRGKLAHSLMEQLANTTMTREEFVRLSEEYFDRFMLINPPLIKENIAVVKNQFLLMMNAAYQGDSHRNVIFMENRLSATHDSGVMLYGYPDRVELLEDGNVAIIDYKTGEEVRHISNDFYSCLQIIIYAYLMERANYSVEYGEFRYIRLGGLVRCVYNDSIKTQLAEFLSDFKDTLLSGEYRKNESAPEQCAKCCYKDICEDRN